MLKVVKWRKEMEEKEKLETYKDVYVVSKYIEDPYLIDERKFDIRIYVLVLSFTPLRVYIYRAGFCRFSRTTYNGSKVDHHSSTSTYVISFVKEALKDMSVHLTNVAVQRRGACEANSSKWPLHSLRLYLMTQIGWERTNRVFEDIQSVVIRSLLAVQQVVTQDKHCFEIYGYDILLDRQLKPWLIEANASPSLQTDSNDDFQLKFNLFHDALNLVDIENKYQGRLPVTCGG